MTRAEPGDILVVALGGGRLTGGLGEAVRRNGWRLMEADRPPAVLRTVLRSSPRVVLVQLPPAGQLPVALGLVQALHRGSYRGQVLAVGAADAEGAEAPVRSAGAGVYLPHDCDAGEVEGAAKALIAVPRRWERDRSPPRLAVI